MNKTDDLDPVSDEGPIVLGTETRLPDEEPIVLDTETRRSRWGRLVVEPAPVLLCAVVLSGGLFYSPHILMTLGFAAFDCLSLSIILWMPRRHPRGTWKLDHDGVAFQPRFGSCIYLRWADVEWVWFNWQKVSLEANGEVVSIPWVWLRKDEVSRSRELIVRSLSGEFDLRADPLKQRSEGRPRPFMHMAFWSCIALAMMACWAASLWIVKWIRLPVSLQKDASSLLTVFLIISVSITVERRREQERKRLFPRWPWRGRLDLPEGGHRSSC